MSRGARGIAAAAAAVAAGLALTACQPTEVSKQAEEVASVAAPYFLTPSREAVGKETAQALEAALAALSEEHREVVTLAVRHGIPVPAFSSALSYFDGYRSARLPANLIQAQRDYFGAHTYERVDASRGKFFHVDWPDPKRPQRPV